MTLQTLKSQIKHNSLSNDLIIFRVSENNFLADQYIDAICKQKDLPKTYIKSLAERTNQALALVYDFTSELSVLKVETLEEETNFDDLDNVIIVCKKVDKKLEKEVEPYIVDIPKLEKQYVLDYILTICPGISQEDANWLYDVTKGDIYKIQSELDKLVLFIKGEQKDIFEQIKNDANSDLYTQQIYKLADALIRRNKKLVKEVIQHMNNLDFDPIALTNITLNNAKNILYLSERSGVDEKALGLKPNQITAIKNQYKGCSVEHLAKIIGFLSKIDIKLKLGYLDMPKEHLMEYIICNLLA